MRLTKKNDGDYVIDNYISLNEPWKSPINKLGQLEDIEEGFGCDLIVFLKALKHGVFYKDFGDNKIKHTNNLSMSCYDGRTFCLQNKWHYFLMEDYGKSKYNQWALTKEELL